MRLGQLARKLALRPTEIVSFLAENDIGIEDGSNTRLQDEHVALVMKQYAPSRMEEVIAEPDDENAVVADLFKASEVLESKLEFQALEEGPSYQNDVWATEIKEEKNEVIKAAKVELPGLKVLGKIEFPEAKKKEVPPVEIIATDEEPTIREESKKTKPENRKWPPPKTERRDQRPKKNPIALEREREAQEGEKKRKAETERKKELRAQHYYKKVKAPSPSTALTGPTPR